MEKITSGEYLIGYSMSAIQIFPLMADPTRAEVIGYMFPSDGMVLLTRTWRWLPPTRARTRRSCCSTLCSRRKARRRWRRAA